MAASPVRRQVSIADVALSADVSASTVSRVVRNMGDVSPATRARVMETVDRLGYRPSPIAQALVSGRTRTFGLLVSDLSNPFYPELAKSIEQEAEKNGYALVICNTEDDATVTLQYLQRLLDQRIEGIIHASVASEESEIEALLRGTPLLYTNRRPRSPLSSYVVGDNRSGAAALVRHLIDIGHTRIAFVHGPGDASNADERLSGLLDTASVFAHVEEPIVVPGSGFDRESGARAARALLSAPRPPTAVVGVNDTVALGVLETVIELGLRVPDDVAVAGFDDIALASSSLVNLTSVTPHTSEIGRRTVRVLLRLLAGTRPKGIREVIEPTLVVRRSTGGGTGARAGAVDGAAAGKLRRRDQSEVAGDA